MQVWQSDKWRKVTQANHFKETVSPDFVIKQFQTDPLFPMISWSNSNFKVSSDMKREKLKLVGTYSYIFKGFDELILTGECHEIYPPLDFSRSILIFLNLCFYVVFKNKPGWQVASICLALINNKVIFAPWQLYVKELKLLLTVQDQGHMKRKAFLTVQDQGYSTWNRKPFSSTLCVRGVWGIAI